MVILKNDSLDKKTPCAIVSIVSEREVSYGLYQSGNEACPFSPYQDGSEKVWYEGQHCY